MCLLFEVYHFFHCGVDGCVDRHGEGVETYGYGLDPAMLSTSTFEGKFANDMKSQGVFTHSDTTKWDRVYDAEGDLVHNRLKGERLTLKAAAKMGARLAQIAQSVVV